MNSEKRLQSKVRLRTGICTYGLKKDTVLVLVREEGIWGHVLHPESGREIKIPKTRYEIDRSDESI